jgi:hypothetical protein
MAPLRNMFGELLLHSFHLSMSQIYRTKPTGRTGDEPEQNFHISQKYLYRLMCVLYFSVDNYFSVNPDTLICVPPYVKRS